MTTVKFDKSVKYEGTRYPAHVLFEVKDEDVPYLQKIGATVMAVAPDKPVSNDTEIELADEHKKEEQSEEDVTQLKEELLKYSVAQLMQFAKDRGIDLQGKTRKADIYNIIASTLN